MAFSPVDQTTPTRIGDDSSTPRARPAQTRQRNSRLPRTQTRSESPGERVRRPKSSYTIRLGGRSRKDDDDAADDDAADDDAADDDAADDDAADDDAADDDAADNDVVDNGAAATNDSMADDDDWDGDDKIHHKTKC